MSSGRGHIAIGGWLESDLSHATDSEGQITLMDRTNKLTAFQVHFLVKIDTQQGFELKVTSVFSCRESNSIVAVGDDEDSAGVLKVWSLDKVDKNGVYLCTSTTKIFGQKTPDIPV